MNQNDKNVPQVAGRFRAGAVRFGGAALVFATEYLKSPSRPALRLRKALVAFVMTAALISVAQAPVVAGEGVKPIAVIELFSSQGCSVSPPANSLLDTLADDQNLIVLSLNVDYWNYLGWKDTLAEPVFTKRQKAYGMSRGDRQVYTPQAVINGQVHVIGSDKNKILAAIAKAQTDSAAPDLGVILRHVGSRIAIDVKPSLAMTQTKPRAEIWAFWVRRRVTVLMESGENSGKTVTYRNATRLALKIGDLKLAGNEPLLIDRPANARDADALVVLVQLLTDAGPGAILGAAYPYEGGRLED
ncbi:DUF1223 domain-containing protein [Bosea eneae]|uniref:DUF1223 domain-containing protein n=1 Tax=Bosea eneae TaxID=151454 RepID=A0ABW0IZE4_9HYPH